MKKIILFVFCCLISTSNFYAQKLSGVLYPSYILKNNVFEISFSGTTGNINYDAASLYLLVDDEIAVNKAVFTIGKGYYDLEIKKEKYKDYDYKTYKISLGKNIPNDIRNLPFQVLVSLQSSEITTTQVLYAMECYDANKTYCIASSFIENNSKIPSRLNLSFYNKDNIAGRCLQIKNNGNFSFVLPDEDYNYNTMVEFWAKINMNDGNWFEIFNKENNESIFAIGNNSFQLVNIIVPNDNLFYDDYFISKNAWYHFNILLNGRTNKAKIYIDDKLFYTFPVNLNTSINGLEFELKNDAEKGNIFIDALKVWSFNNTPSLSFVNKHYLNYLADSSNLYFEFMFDNTEVFQKMIYSDKYNYSIKSIDFVESDAPIFSRAPILNVDVFGGYNSIDWVSLDENAKLFVLEKSANGSAYSEIYRTESETDLHKTYYYSDSKNIGNEVTYYRVKQINTDESVVYSNQLKVGAAEKKTFDIIQNYPNPFNPKTSITIEILESTYIEISVYNIVGKEICVLHKGNLPVGEHSYEFNATGMPSGIYLCKVTNGHYIKVQKMILTK